MKQHAKSLPMRAQYMGWRQYVSNRIVCCALALTTISTANMAQSIDPGLVGLLFPAIPTSSDNIKLSVPAIGCSNFSLYAANSYSMSMTQNNLSIKLGPRKTILSPVDCIRFDIREDIDIGRLPPGSYTLTLTFDITAGGGTPLRALPFTVVDARATKQAPYVRVDYSGHWWDPADSGWGLFIWQDAKSPTDNIFAAWFTYNPDGKSAWYTFQPTWQTDTATTTAPLAFTSRLAGSTSPPPTPTSFVPVGTASLDFTIPSNGTVDTGKITYTFTNGPTLTRNIQRFKP